MPPSPEQEAIRWILGEGGNVEVLEPLDLRQKIHDFDRQLEENAKNRNEIDKVIDGESAEDVLDYVNFSDKALVRTMENWVSRSVKEGKITLQEGKEFLNIYRGGLYGYTYLE